MRADQRALGELRKGRAIPSIKERDKVVSEISFPVDLKVSCAVLASTVVLGMPSAAQCQENIELGPRVSCARLASAVVVDLPSAAPCQENIEILDSKPLVNRDIEHRAKFLQMTTNKVPSRVQAIESLTNEIRTVTEANQNGIYVSDQEVDMAYQQVAVRMGLDRQRLTQLLIAGGASEDTLKRRLRAHIARTKLMGAKPNGSERSETK
jgi:hypothetical protein